MHKEPKIARIDDGFKKRERSSRMAKKGSYLQKWYKTRTNWRLGKNNQEIPSKSERSYLMNEKSRLKKFETPLHQKVL